jgi:hypothetical protein
MIEKVESGVLGFEGSVGPVKVPSAASQRAEPGWSMNVASVRTGTVGRIVEVGRRLPLRSHPAVGLSEKFLMMTNWDAQYIGQQAKDVFNSLGIGAVWNVMDAGQQFTLHVVVTSGSLGFIVLVHLAQIRRRGVAPPPGAEHLEIEVGQPSPVPSPSSAPAPLVGSSKGAGPPSVVTGSSDPVTNAESGGTR